MKPGEYAIKLYLGGFSEISSVERSKQVINYQSLEKKLCWVVGEKNGKIKLEKYCYNPLVDNNNCVFNKIVQSN